jgi:diguanylate cyclase (GGDEF)-like protein/PAS domain S-box-containing protein
MDKPMVIAVDRPLHALFASSNGMAYKYCVSFAVLSLLLAVGLQMHQQRRNLMIRLNSDREAERQAAMTELRQNEERFHDLTKLSSDWYWEQNDQFRFVRLPGNLDQKTRDANNAHIGKTRWEMGALNLTEADWQAHRSELQSHQEFHNFEMLRRGNEGEMHWTSVSGAPIFDPSGTFIGYRGVARDITAQKLSEERIKQYAFYDSLTQLPNRRLFRDRLTLAFVASKRSQRHGALLFVDLDNFKSLNDKYGHEFGDLLLVEVARRLKLSIREIDTVARYGGDEFVIVLSHLELQPDESASQAGQIAEKIRSSLDQPYLLSLSKEDGTVMTIEHCCTASIGIALFFNHDVSEEDLIKRADMAMYDAKVAGRNTVRFFEPNNKD